MIMFNYFHQGLILSWNGIRMIKCYHLLPFTRENLQKDPYVQQIICELVQEKVSREVKNRGEQGTVPNMKRQKRKGSNNAIDKISNFIENIRLEGSKRSDAFYFRHKLEE